MTDPAELSLWAITDNPTDFPGQFVARRFIIGAGFHAVTLDHHVADTLEEVRAMLPNYLVRLNRDPNDDPKIVESWV